MKRITGTHLGILVMVLFFASQTVFADKLTHKFKNLNTKIFDKL